MNGRPERRVFFVLVVVAAILLLCPAGGAQSDDREFEAMLDELIVSEMEQHMITGAAVSVVFDGQVFAQGYGLADVDADRPVDPVMTMFDIGSIGKLFTWTAAMQLVDQGSLDLDEDINEYLDFAIPATYPAPVTMYDLMAHAGGLDEFFYGTAAAGVEDLEELDQFVEERLPRRVRPPGQISAYTNWGAALAGLVVEGAAGQSFERYVEQHVLEPLEMTHSTTHQPVPEAFQPHLSRNYEIADGSASSFQSPLEFYQLRPAGSVRASAADMANFMRAHLEQGAFGQVAILSPERTEQMHTQHFAAHEGLTGWAHGFMVFGHDPYVIGHNGVSDHFYSELRLVPDEHFGIFVTTNTDGGRDMAENVVTAVIDYLFPSTHSPPVAITRSFTDVGQWAGSYRSANTSYTTAEKLNLVTSILHVAANDDGSLTVAFGQEETRYVEIEPMLFERDDGRRVDESDRLALIPDPDGRPRYITYGLGAIEKLPWYETMPFNLAFAGTTSLLFLSVPIAILASRISTRLRHEADSQPPRARWARRSAVAMVIVFIASMAGLMSAFATTSAILTGTAALYQLGQWLVLPVAVLAIASAVFAVYAWKDKLWSTSSRLHYTLVAAAGVATIWWYFNWQLLG